MERDHISLKTVSTDSSYNWLPARRYERIVPGISQRLSVAFRLQLQRHLRQKHLKLKHLVKGRSASPLLSCAFAQRALAATGLSSLISIAFALCAWLLTPVSADAKAAFKSMTDMIVDADVIAVVRVENVENTSVKSATWTYSKRATTVPLQVLKGTLPDKFYMLGGENFICAQCNYEPGKALVFLKKEGNAYRGNNWHLSIRPIRESKVEWFKEDGKSLLDLQPVPLKVVLPKVRRQVKQDEQLENLPACMETLRKAAYLADGTIGEQAHAAPEFTAYKEGLKLKGVGTDQLELMLKRATPAGKIYTALLMAKHYPSFATEVLNQIKDDRDPVVVRSGCEVLHDYTVGQVASALLTKRKFMGFSI